MTVLEWNGEIGYDLIPSMVSNDLKNANGDDITAKLSTPGGNIIDGGDMFISLLDYRKNNPDAKMILEIGSVAASYGSFLSASPVWDIVKVSDISMAMYHNPANFAFGDFMTMEENAKFLKDARNMYLSVYSNRSGKTESEMIDMMNKTTWLMGGQAIIDAGFADELISTENDTDVNMLAKQAEQAYMSVANKLASQNNNGIDYNKISMSLNTIKDSVMKPETPGKPDEIKPVDSGQSKMEVTVDTKQELQKEKPELYDESVKDGVMLERARVKALSEMKAKEEYKSIPEVVAVIDKCIEDGTEMSATQPLIMAAMMKIMADPARMAAIESPEDLQGGNGNTGSEDESQEIGEV